MTLPRYGSNDEPFYITEEDDTPRCWLCGKFDFICKCAPCDECAELCEARELQRANDNRTRCAECHIRATTKVICGEHPAVPDKEGSTAANLLHIGLFLSAVVSWLAVLS